MCGDLGEIHLPPYGDPIVSLKIVNWFATYFMGSNALQPLQWRAPKIYPKVFDGFGVFVTYNAKRAFPLKVR